MGWFRVSIGRIMILVALLAVSLAFVRMAAFYDDEMAAGVALPGMLLPWGVFQAVRLRGRPRGFWAGFVVAGLAATAAFVWATATPGSGLFLALVAYTRRATDLFRWMQIGRWMLFLPRPMLAEYALFAVVWALPQIAVALFGGLLGREAFGRGDGSPLGSSPPEDTMG